MKVYLIVEEFIKSDTIIVKKIFKNKLNAETSLSEYKDRIKQRKLSNIIYYDIEEFELED